MQTTTSNSAVPNPPDERHYSPSEIATQWNLSENTIRRIFAEEPGVMRIGQGSRLVGRKYRRRHIVLRIPQSVFERVKLRLMHKGPASVSLPADRLGRVPRRGGIGAGGDIHAAAAG